MSDPCRCDPEAIFELADGALGPGRVREVRAHLDDCPGCRQLYEEELELNASLRAMKFAQSRSVCPQIAMELPTRPLKARLLWAALALALLLVASLALSLDGASPMDFAVSALGAFWSLVSGFADVVQAVLVVAGPVLLVALAAGALFDLLLAAALLRTTRRRAREA
jgi:predicted anti-sigma-YlaC factor YlaD